MVELERWLEARLEGVWLFHARAQPHSSNVPYGLVRALFGWRFEILDTDTRAVAHAKLARGVGALFGDRSEEQIALIGQLIGLDYSVSPHLSGIAGDGRQLRDRAFHAMTQYFRLLLEEGQALVVLLDDLHWADEGSLDFVEHVAQACRDLPMMVLCLTRPGLAQRRPRWGGGTSNHERVELAPLSKRDSGELVESLLRRIATVPAALRDLVTNSAEGNPYFMEELIAMLIDDGVIVAGGDPWRVEADRLVNVHIPSTLAGVLQARLDGLPPTEKMVLQQASVVGHVFWDEPL
jgi:predicted ATPase